MANTPKPSRIKKMIPFIVLAVLACALLVYFIISETTPKATPSATETPPQATATVAPAEEATGQDESLEARLAGRENLLSPEMRNTTIRSSVESTHRYIRLFSGMEPGQTYLLLVGSVLIESGQAEGVTARLYDFDANEAIDAQMLRANYTAPQGWVFTMPADRNPDKVSLLLYAGIAGRTKDKIVDLADVRLYKWDDDAPSLISDLNARPDIPWQSDETLIRNAVGNASNDIGKLAAHYAQAATNLLPENVAKGFTVTAGDEHNFAYDVLALGMTPGESYLFTLGKSTVERGSADWVSLRLFNFTTNEALLRKEMKANLEHTQGWVFTVPTDAAQDDVRLLIYAGVANETPGNTVAFEDMGFYVWDASLDAAGLVALAGT